MRFTVQTGAKSMAWPKLSLALLIASALSAIAQIPNQLALLSSPTNALSDGSIIRIEAVSYGIIHRIPTFYGQSNFFKSASPAIMITTSRRAPGKHSLDEIWTQAEALDESGHWYELRKRTEPRADGLQLDGYEGPPPTEMWETWEFPYYLKSSPWLQVRIELYPIEKTNTKTSNVEFKIPNDEKWREQSAKEQTNGFNEHDWLNKELWEAAYEDQADIVIKMMNEGASPNACDSSGMSALAIASQDGHLDVVRYLLDHGADVNAHSKGKITDRTALIAAASMDGTEAIVKLLVERGADVNTIGDEGWTALIWAAREGNVENVKYLLSKGADPAIKAADGRTIIELIEETDTPNHSEIIKTLKETQKVQ